MASVTAENGKRRWRLPEALPVLGPVAMRIYVALWSLLLVAAIVLPVVGAWFEFQQRANPSWTPYGVTIGPLEGGRLEIGEVFGEPARAAGLRRGDRITAIDGRPVPHISHYQQVRDWVVGPEGKATRFTIAPARGNPRDVVLVRERRNFELPFAGTGLSPVGVAAVLSVSSLAMSLVLVIAAALLFRRRQQPVAALISIAYLALAASALLGFGASAILGTSAVTYWIQPFGWGCLLLGLVAMPDGRLLPRWTVWIAALVLLVAVIEVTAGLPNLIGNLALSVLLLTAVTRLALRYRALPPGPQRQQLRWVFLGFTWGGGLLALVLLSTFATTAAARADPRWLLWGPIILTPLFALGLAACAGGLLVSLLRYRLYDADAVISRSAGYAVLTLLLAGAFGASAKLIEWVFEASYGQDAGALPGAIGAGLAVVLITPMHSRIHRWAERRFQKDLLHLRRDLPDCVNDLRETASLAELLDEVLARVEAGTRAVRSEISIDGKTVASRGAEGDLAFSVPLTIAHQDANVGVLLVGLRPDGSALGRDDRQALTEVADPIARAIRIVRTREAEKLRIDRRFRRLEARRVKAAR